MSGARRVPRFHVRPVPRRTTAHGPAGFGEAEVAEPPSVHGVPLDTEAVGDLHGTHDFGVLGHACTAAVTAPPNMASPRAVRSNRASE